MATGASTANVAVTLIDARLGVLQQSRRHAYIASLLGIPHLAVAVNKMDLPECTRDVFERICRDFSAFASKLGFKDVRFIPVSALRGDNIVERSAALPWYDGQTILEYLEQVPIASDRNLRDFRYPVQYVIRPHLDYRGYAAEIASGQIARGDRVMVLPSRRTTTVASIDTFEGQLERARAPMSVTLTLADDVDVSRGDMLVHPENVPHVEQRFEAMLVWMNEHELDLGASYFIKHTTTLVRAEFEQVLSRTDLETLEDEPARTLGLNDIGRVVVRSHRALHFDAYSDNPRTGAFIVVDALSNATVAAGMISGPVKARSADIEGARPQSRISPEEREARLGQRGLVVLFTGLPGAGKTQLAYAVEHLLHARGRFSLVLDPADAVSAQNAAAARQPAEVSAAALELCERGVGVGWITLLAFATPDAEGRERVRERAGAGRYIEVYLRPGAGASALRHQPPAQPDLVVAPHEEGLEVAAHRVICHLEEHGALTPAAPAPS